MEPSGAKLLGFAQHRLYQNSQTLKLHAARASCCGSIAKYAGPMGYCCERGEEARTVTTTSPILIRSAECFGLPLTMRRWQRAEKRLQKSSKAPPCDGQRHEARRDCATSWRVRTCILSLIKNTDESSCRSCRLRSSNCAACC